MKIEIQGQDSVKATEELLSIEGIEGSYETVSEVVRGEPLTTIASIVAISLGTLTIAEKLYQWNQKYQKSLQNPTGSKIEKVLIVAPNGNRLLLKDASLELGEKPFLFILDDFEWNLEPRKGRYILKPKVAPILKALVEAMLEVETDNKIIITCRYEFDSELLDFFFSQGLEPLRKAELTKKLNRLEHFNSGNLSEVIRDRALNLADGNPRLLEFLDNEVLGKDDSETKLTELEQSPELWKDQIIWEELYQLIDEPLQEVLSHCLVYEIPVPMTALEAVCDSLPNYQQQLQRGLDLGLIEMSPETVEEDRVYRVSRILPHIISNIKLPEAPKVYSLYRKAYEKLYELWGHKENDSKEKWQEIFRLLFADKDNPHRFRLGFSQMLSVQFNEVSDRVLESQLRQLKDELPEENFYSQLEDYLRQGDWRKADEETAWLFYLVMVQQRYKDWSELCQKFPNQILQKIDQFWVDYSQGKFGFSIQKRIWESLGVNTNAKIYETWEKFCKQVEWYSEEDNEWKEYNSLSFSIITSDGNLPCCMITRDVFGGWGLENDRRNMELLSLLEEMEGKGGVSRWFVASFFSHQSLTHNV